MSYYFPALDYYLPAGGLDYRRKDGWLGHIHESHHWCMVRTWLRYDSQVGMGMAGLERVCVLTLRPRRTTHDTSSNCAYCTAACTVPYPPYVGLGIL
jgi:hypothetical protein